MAIRVYVVDDHPMLLLACKTVMAQAPDLVWVGESQDVIGALLAIRDARPDVLLLDVVMPDLSGFELLREIRVISPRTRVLIFSGYDNPAFVHEAYRLGAMGYAMKTALGARLLQAIRSVSQGEHYHDPTLARFDVIEHHAACDAAERLPSAGLTLDERKVLGLIVSRRDAASIAERLGMSRRKVQALKGTGLRKLGLVSAEQQLREALKKALGTPDSD